MSVDWAATFASFQTIATQLQRLESASTRAELLADRVEALEARCNAQDEAHRAATARIRHLEREHKHLSKAHKQHHALIHAIRRMVQALDAEMPNESAYSASPISEYRPLEPEAVDNSPMHEDEAEPFDMPTAMSLTASPIRPSSPHPAPIELVVQESEAPTNDYAPSVVSMHTTPSEHAELQGLVDFLEMGPDPPLYPILSTPRPASTTPTEIGEPPVPSSFDSQATMVAGSSQGLRSSPWHDPPALEPKPIVPSPPVRNNLSAIAGLLPSSSRTVASIGSSARVPDRVPSPVSERRGPEIHSVDDEPDTSMSGSVQSLYTTADDDAPISPPASPRRFRPAGHRVSFTPRHNTASPRPPPSTLSSASSSSNLAIPGTFPGSSSNLSVRRRQMVPSRQAVHTPVASTPLPPALPAPIVAEPSVAERRRDEPVATAEPLLSPAQQLMLETIRQFEGSRGIRTSQIISYFMADEFDETGADVARATDDLNYLIRHRLVEMIQGTSAEMADPEYDAPIKSL